MAEPKLTRLELQIIEALRTVGEGSIREVQETFPAQWRANFLDGGEQALLVVHKGVFPPDLLPDFLLCHQLAGREGHFKDPEV